MYHEHWATLCQSRPLTLFQGRLYPPVRDFQFGYTCSSFTYNAHCTVYTVHCTVHDECRYAIFYMYRCWIYSLTNILLLFSIVKRFLLCRRHTNKFLKYSQRDVMQIEQKSLDNLSIFLHFYSKVPVYK